MTYTKGLCVQVNAFGTPFVCQPYSYMVSAAALTMSLQFVECAKFLDKREYRLAFMFFEF